jgi:hypothetical protein
MIFTGVIKVIFKKPFITIYMAVAALLCVVAEIYNPVGAVLSGLHMMTGGNVFQDILSVLQYLWEPGLLPIILLASAAVCLACALVFSLVFSGYFEILHNALNGIYKVKGAYFKGLKRNFLRMVLVFFIIFLVLIIIIFFLMFVTVPAIVLTKTAMASSQGLIPAAIFVDILTILSCFFIAAYALAYLTFWIPAYASHIPVPLKSARKAANNGFKNIMTMLAGFMAAFALFYIASSHIYDMNLIVLIRWLFATVCATLFVTWLFTAFRTYLSGGKRIKTDKRRKQYA